MYPLTIEPPVLFLYDIPLPSPHRWVPGDEYVRKVVRTALKPLRGSAPAGLAKVTSNLVLGLQKMGVDYRLVKGPKPALTEGVFGVLGGPMEFCRVMAQSGRCIVGPGILNSAREWPDLFTNSQAVFNIQNCEWSASMYRSLYGDRVKIWTMGIEHERFVPRASDPKDIDFLIYDKIRWRDSLVSENLLQVCQEELRKADCSSLYLRYGKYPRGRESAYHDLLRRCKALLYLSENETQGFAYNEALSMGVPMLAWNYGKWCDPSRFDYGLDDVPATSIPYWDDRCGVDFRTPSDFAERLGLFLEKLRGGKFAPREYVLENLRLEQGAQRYLNLIGAAETNDR